MIFVKYIARKLSILLAKHPRLMFSIQEIWLQLGYSVLDLRMASWVIRRPEWLRKKPNSGPSCLEPELVQKDGVNTDIAIRLIKMYRSLEKKVDTSINTKGSMWEVLRESHYDSLISYLSSGDITNLERYLARLFRTKTVNGYTYGSTFDAWPHRWNYLPIQIELSVVQLAEALGLIRAECHEQGEVAFWRKIFSEKELIGKLESYFGFKVEQPRYGDPRGVLFGGRFLTRETCSHLYSACKIRNAINRQGLHGPLNIIEIGGGFGGTCFWLRKIFGDRVSRYVIVDLPEVNLVQGFFLGSIYPDQTVLAGEAVHDASSPIQLVQCNQLNEIDFRPNVLINQDSMPEMPESEVVRYLDWASKNLDGLFINFNQETLSASGGHLQILVPEVVGRFPQFRRISREASWDRRGYVEEVYETI